MPALVVGVGIGGTFEKCALMAKQALTRPLNEHSEIPYIKEMEEEALERINQSGIGPGGLGGTTTALGSKYQYLSHTYCRPARCCKYLLSCEQTFRKNPVEPFYMVVLNLSNTISADKVSYIIRRKPFDRRKNRMEKHMRVPLYQTGSGHPEIGRLRLSYRDHIHGQGCRP